MRTPTNRDKHTTIFRESVEFSKQAISVQNKRFVVEGVISLSLFSKEHHRQVFAATNGADDTLVQAVRQISRRPCEVVLAGEKLTGKKMRDFKPFEDNALVGLLIVKLYRQAQVAAYR